jgi:hypothetical protein
MCVQIGNNFLPNFGILLLPDFRENVLVSLLIRGNKILRNVILCKILALTVQAIEQTHQA